MDFCRKLILHSFIICQVGFCVCLFIPGFFEDIIQTELQVQEILCSCLHCTCINLPLFTSLGDFGDKLLGIIAGQCKLYWSSSDQVLIQLKILKMMSLTDKTSEKKSKASIQSSQFIMLGRMKKSSVLFQANNLAGI